MPAFGTALGFAAMPQKRFPWPPQGRRGSPARSGTPRRIRIGRQGLSWLDEARNEAGLWLMAEAEGGRIFFSNAGRSLEVEDEIRLLSVGVDIGSSTSHLVFSTLLLERLDN